MLVLRATKDTPRRCFGESPVFDNQLPVDDRPVEPVSELMGFGIGRASMNRGGIKNQNIGKEPRLE